MTKRFAIRSTACAAALFAGTAAMADVTAQQVWDDWSSNFEFYGDGVVTTGSETLSGGTLTVTNLAFEMADPSGANVSSVIPEITMVENGDGTVSVTISPETLLRITDDYGLDMQIGVRSEGLVITASGDANAINYDLQADSYSISLDRLMDGDEAIPGQATMVMSNITGSYLSQSGNLRLLTYDLSVGGIEMLVDFANPDNAEESLNFTGVIDGMDLALNLAIPNDFDPNNPEMMFVNGFSVDGAYALGASTYSFAFNDRWDAVAVDASVGGAQLAFDFDKDNVSYDAAATAVDFNMVTGEFPFPIQASAAEYGFGFQMPLSRTEAPAPFRLSMNLIDLAISDAIWGLADPQGILPRTPATITADITGTAKLFFDILDPAQADQMARADIPGELHTLNMSRFLISFAGAEITGEANLAVDNNTPSPGLGLPMTPVGSFSLNASGINGLLQNLVSMGIIGQGEVSQAQLMMGLFAQQTGEDSLSTTFEINEQGHVLANGQRIQ